MNEIRNKIFDEITKERDYQDSKWGTDFDDKNTINDWAAYINIYLSKATTMQATEGEKRTNLIKVAALAVALLESYDRNNGFPPRHYD